MRRAARAVGKGTWSRSEVRREQTLGQAGNLCIQTGPVTTPGEGQCGASSWGVCNVGRSQVLLIQQTTGLQCGRGAEEEWPAPGPCIGGWAPCSVVVLMALAALAARGGTCAQAGHSDSRVGLWTELIAV